MRLKNKKILITAGPTWVAIDNVRVISNTATGTTGILLACALNRLGARVTLLLGPSVIYTLPANIKVHHFRFFKELEELMTAELSSGKYEIIIHSAAVSDYRLKKPFNTKLNSNRKDLCLKLVKTPKLIQQIKKIAPAILAVGFKFQPQAEKKNLINMAIDLQNQANLDFVIANTVIDHQYRGYIVDHKYVSKDIKNKKDLVLKLIAHITKAFK